MNSYITQYNELINITLIKYCELIKSKFNEKLFFHFLHFSKIDRLHF